MLIRKIAITLLLGLFITGNAFAGKEDWNGVFTLKDDSGNSNTVQHTPTGITYLFFNVGECLHLAKGSKMNGVVIKEEVNLCRDSNVPTFTSEVSKLGKLLNKSITLGPTYSK